MLQTLKTARSQLGTLALAPVAWVMSHTLAVAQNADVTGALETNQDALAAVETSALTGDGVTQGAQIFTNVMLAIAGAAGIAMVIWGLVKLYKISNEGEQARDSVVMPIGSIVVGGLMTIAAVVTAFVPNAFLA